jgi:hypothetical protein
MSKTMDAMELHNVHGAKDYGDDNEITSFTVHPTIAEVIWELASKNPLWQFHATYGTRIYERTKLAYTTFKVKLNGKELGTISRANTRRGEQAISVHCKRIADKMDRKDSYVTTDPKKAIAKVRKEFAPKTAKELVADAMQKAADVANTVYRETDVQVRRANGVVHDALQNFYLEGPGLEIYKSYLHADRPDDVKVMQAMGRIVDLKADMMTIGSVKEKMGTSDTALVVLDEGKYLVKILSDLQLYDDTTLPQDLRGKLGLLKLVQPNQFVSSAGFRVSEEVFVIDLSA